MATTINNATFDAALAAIPAPYGPLTRTGTTTNLETGTRPATNSDVRYHVKSAAGYDVYISYEELASSAKYMPILKEAHGVRSVIADLKTYINALDQALDTVTNPLTLSEIEIQAILRLFQAFPHILTMLPFQAFYETGTKDPLVADCSVTVNNTTRTVTFTNTTVGDVTAYLWSFGDGDLSLEKTPPAKVYGGSGPGSFTVRLLAVGPRGISTDTATVTFT